MSLKNEQHITTKKGWVFVWIYAWLSLSILMILTFLTIFQTSAVNLSWINGFLISVSIAGLGLVIIRKSWTILLKTENHYLYVLFLMLRLGLYLFPFLLAFFIFDGTIINFFGVLLGFIPLVLFPWLTSFNKKILTNY